MHVYPLCLTKKRLDGMPEAERFAVLLMGHACNEINFLRKLMLVSIPRTSPAKKIVDRVQTGQVLILMRILLGKCFEAWRLFSKRVQPLRSKYLGELSDEGRSALVELGRYFADERLANIRNRLSFHYGDDKDLLRERWSSLPEGDAWDFYLSDRRMNTFYYASELAITGVLMHLSLSEEAREHEPSLTDEQLGFREACDLNNRVSDLILTVFGEFIAAIVDVQWPEMHCAGAEQVEVVKMSDLNLPFFWDEADYDQSLRHQTE